MLNHSLRENRVHGSATYPISVYSVDMGVGETVLACHWHCEYEFLFLTQGTALFQIGANNYTLTAGDFIFVSSEELHAGYPVEGETCSFSAVVFDASFLFSHENDVLQEKYFAPLTTRRFLLPEYYMGQTPWCGEVMSALREVVSLNKARPATYELLTKMHMLKVFALLFEHCPVSEGRRDPLAEERAGQLKVILDYIHTNYQEHITLKDMAAKMNMSEGYFCRFFKRYMRKTPFEYLIEYRIHKATLLLDGSGIKVSQVAEDTGFENISYFTEVFKKVKRCTPSEYRRHEETSAN